MGDAARLREWRSLRRLRHSRKRSPPPLHLDCDFRAVEDDYLVFVYSALEFGAQDLIECRPDVRTGNAAWYCPRPGELRFDMYDAEFTPVGRDCTFQTLVTRFNLRDKALTAIGEIVHDIDSKDDQQSGDGRHSGNDPRDR